MCIFFNNSKVCRLRLSSGLNSNQVMVHAWHCHLFLYQWFVFFSFPCDLTKRKHEFFVVSLSWCVCLLSFITVMESSGPNQMLLVWTNLRNDYNWCFIKVHLFMTFRAFYTTHLLRDKIISVPSLVISELAWIQYVN